MLKPIGSRLIIELLGLEEKTQAGILLPETAKEKPQKGRVVSVGAGKMKDNGMREMLDVKEGDIVYFSKYSPTELKVGDREYFIIDFDDVLGVEQ